MISLKNNKNISVTFDGLQIEPFGEIAITEKKWGELYKKKEIRESILIGYLSATVKKSTNSDSGIENKKKGK